MCACVCLYCACVFALSARARVLRLAGFISEMCSLARARMPTHSRKDNGKRIN